MASWHSRMARLRAPPRAALSEAGRGRVAVARAAHGEGLDVDSGTAAQIGCRSRGVPVMATPGRAIGYLT